MQIEAHAKPTGELGLRVIRGRPDWRDLGLGLGRELTTAEIIEAATPKKGLPEEVNDWRADNFAAALRKTRPLLAARRVARRNGLPYLWTQLWIAKICADGRRLEYGLANAGKLVTTAGVNFIVDAFQNIVELENLKFHGMGTGVAAEATGDTALGTELTTEYNPNNTRATGTTVEGASANIYRTVGTNTIDSGTPAVTEHGVFTQAATGGGTLLDRSVFSAINLAANDGIEFTYELTVSAGG